MDALTLLLDQLKKEPRVQGQFLGLAHILIGRRITTLDGHLVSAGLSWRDLATRLKKIRWDPDAAQDLGVDPATLPPRDRYRHWYVAISRAQVDSSHAVAAGDRLLDLFRDIGYLVGPAPAVTA